MTNIIIKNSVQKTKTSVFLLLLAGLTIRLTYALFSHDFWLDEALNYQIAQNNLQTIIRALSFDTWPPLYALFMHYWQKLGQGVLFLRLPSVLFGTLTLVLIWRLAKKLFGQKTALFALILASVSPPLVYFSAENRGYALFVLLTVLVILAYLNLIKKGSLKNIVLFALTGALAAYTHYFAALLLISLPIASYLTNHFTIKLRTLLFSYLLILILVTPWLLYTLGNPKPQCLCASSGTGLIFTQFFMALGGAGIITLKRIFEGPTPIFIRVFLISSAIISNFFFAKSLTQLKNKNNTWLLALFFLPLFAIFTISFYQPLFSVRSFIFLATIFITVTAYALQQTSKTYLYLLIVLSILSLIATSQKPFFEYEPLKKMGTTLIALDAPSTQIIHAGLYTYLPATYYAPSLSQQVLKSDLPEPLINSLHLNTFLTSPTSRTYRTYVFVLAIDRYDHRQVQRILTDLYNAYGEPQKVNLNNIRILIFRPKNA